jgi:transcriptional regulator with XRE-family HTH domain
MGQRSKAHVALGKAVRHYRADRAISQEELAHRSGLHRTYVGGIERGERNPSYGSITSLSAALGVAPSELLTHAERQKPS